MSFTPDSTLYAYDVFPKVVVANQAVQIHIRALGCRSVFAPEQSYTLGICALTQGAPHAYPASADYRFVPIRCNAAGELVFTHTFPAEQQYFLRLYPHNDTTGKPLLQLSVYCVAQDLAGLYPLRGDLHMHTTYSDGQQIPGVVVADYRARGYDFMAITDHRRYYPSLRAMAEFRDVPTSLVLVPGEEVHMPAVNGQVLDAHIVHFGGDYSVNALVEGDATKEVGTAWQTRALTPDCPPVRTQEAFAQEITTRAAQLNLPAQLDATTVAGLCWVYEQIKKAGGLSIYVHPTWISDVFHVPDVLHRYLVEQRVFDCFEVLGGEIYYEQNGLQTAQYYEDRANGYRYPVVGSTDTHSSLPTNPAAEVCSTIVFSAQNERHALMDAIRDFKSVAVDTRSAEPRLVGELRLVRYACFLLQHYFPQHDAICRAEGELLREYTTGTPSERSAALAMLTALQGRVEACQKKYFAF